MRSSRATASARRSAAASTRARLWGGTRSASGSSRSAASHTAPGPPRRRVETAAGTCRDSRRALALSRSARVQPREALRHQLVRQVIHPVLIPQERCPGRPVGNIEAGDAGVVRAQKDARQRPAAQQMLDEEAQEGAVADDGDSFVRVPGGVPAGATALVPRDPPGCVRESRWPPARRGRFKRSRVSAGPFHQPDSVTPAGKTNSGIRRTGWPIE